MTHTVGRVRAVEPGLVRLDDGTELRARHILLTHGRGASRSGSVDSLKDAQAAHRRIAGLRQGGQVEVIGAGLTGIELAAAVAEAWPALNVRLIAQSPLGHDLSPKAAVGLAAALERLGVEVARVAAGGDLTLDASGPAPEPMGSTSDFALDGRGRLRTDDRLRILDSGGAPLEAVWGAGDAIAVDGRPWLRGGCAAAEPLAANAADNIRRAVLGKDPVPADVGFAFRCISLGRRDGIIQFVTPDDRPRKAWLGGRLGAMWKEAISTFAWKVPVSWSRSYPIVRGPASDRGAIEGLFGVRR